MWLRFRKLYFESFTIARLLASHKRGSSTSIELKVHPWYENSIIELSNTNLVHLPCSIGLQPLGFGIVQGPKVACNQSKAIYKEKNHRLT